METILSIALGSITTAIAVFGRATVPKPKPGSPEEKKENRRLRIVKALKVASAAITEALVPDHEEV